MTDDGRCRFLLSSLPCEPLSIFSVCVFSKFMICLDVRVTLPRLCCGSPSICRNHAMSTPELHISRWNVLSSLLYRIGTVKLPLTLRHAARPMDLPDHSSSLWCDKQDRILNFDCFTSPECYKQLGKVAYETRINTWNTIFNAATTTPVLQFAFSGDNRLA